MIDRLAAWQSRQLALLWLGAITLTVVLSLLRVGTKAFWLLPYPTWHPASWLRIYSAIARADPLLAAALLIPPATLVFTVLVWWARRARTRATAGT